MKWVFKSNEYPDGLIRLKSINIVNGYMQVPLVDYTESFSLVTTDTSINILPILTLYHKYEGYIAELCDVESTFLNPDMSV